MNREWNAGSATLRLAAACVFGAAIALWQLTQPTAIGPWFWSVVAIAFIGGAIAGTRWSFPALLVVCAAIVYAFGYRDHSGRPMEPGPAAVAQAGLVLLLLLAVVNWAGVGLGSGLEWLASSVRRRLAAGR